MKCPCLMLLLDIATNPSASIRKLPRTELYIFVSGELIKVEDYVSILSNILDITRKFLGMIAQSNFVNVHRSAVGKELARSWQ